MSLSKKSTQPVSKWPLKLGSSGLEVKDVQNYLNYYNNCNLKVDGIFGLSTEKCVKDVFNVSQIDQNSYNNVIGKGILAMSLNIAING